MKKYLSFFRIRFSTSLQYRIAAYAGICTQFAWGFMSILLFGAFNESNPAAMPMEFSQLSSYMWLQQAFMSMFFVWFTDNEIFAAIASGNIAYELVRPLDIYTMWFVKNMALRLARAVLRCMPILVVAAFLPYPYGLSLPPDIIALICFIVSAIIGFCLVIAFCMLLYISTFFTISPLGVRVAAAALSEILCGAVVPIPFMPDGLRQVVELLPFASMQNLPLRIYSGNIAGDEMIKLMLLQVFWLIFLITVGVLWMRYALKRVVVQGG